MQDYRYFEPEELAMNSLFQRWKLDNDATASAFWEEWLVQNPDRAELVEKACALLLAIREQNRQHLNKQDQLTEAEIQQEISQLYHSLHGPKPEPVRWLWSRPIQYGIAASVLILLGLFSWYRRQPTAVQEKVTYRELVAQASNPLTEVTNTTRQPRLVNLPDQSRILLYPQSRVSYANPFSGVRREVYLSGKAFFDVTKNPSRPFYVYADKLVTKVLGTSFLVQTNESANQVRVTVKTGKVSVYAQSQAPSANQLEDYKLSGTVLIPNQQIIFSTGDARLVKRSVSEPDFLEKAAHKQSFTFKRTPVAEVFAVLERAYGIPILFDKERMSNCYLTASFSDEPLSDQLALICHTINAHVDQLDGYVLISSQGCQ